MHRQPEHRYEANKDVLVLSADSAGGFVAPTALVNHVMQTKIYGDGRVVFIEPSVGFGVIHQGKLSPERIDALLQLLEHRHFWDFASSYQGPNADLPTITVSAQRRGEPRKSVSCYGGAQAAPPGFMECYEALIVPKLQPSDVLDYVREPISAEQLAAGCYDGFEYQKKLDTPIDWVWHDAGRSSQWRRPEPQAAVELDSSYLAPPVNGCHHIRIGLSGAPPSPEGRIQFDRNAMSPDAFGDIGISTHMYFPREPMTLSLVQHDDQKRLYQLLVPAAPALRLRLALFGAAAQVNGARLLVYDDHGILQASHAMSRLP